MLRRWLGLVGSLCLEGGVEKLGGLEYVTLGLHMAGVRYLIIGTDRRTLIVIEYPVLSLHLAGVVGVGRNPLLGVELLIDARIVILHVVTTH